MSVILNFIEGYARRIDENYKTYKNFLRIAYGSLKESQYLLFFSCREGYLKKEEYNKLCFMGDEIGAMLYKIDSGF